MNPTEIVIPKTERQGVFEQYTAKKKARGEPVYVEKAIKDMTGKKLLVMPMR